MTQILRLLPIFLLSSLLHSPGGAQTFFLLDAAAQKTSDSERTLIAVQVTGSKRFTQDEVIAASGLRTGFIAGDDDFKKAARILGDTGAFTDIAYSYSYSAAGTKLELKVTDALKFVPAHFEDFVWFSGDELLRRLKERVPLFTGELPLSGRLPEEVSDVLQAMLVEKNIPGHVNYLRASREDGPITAINYSVSDVSIRVRNMEFTGAGAAELPLLEAAARKLPDPEYSRDRLRVFVERQLLPVYYARGYLKASFATPQPSVGKPEAGNGDTPPNQTLVDVALAVTPGQQYKLTRVVWSGNHEIPADMLQTMIQAQPGKPANTVQLADDLANVRKLYGSKGYIQASIKATPQFDDAAATVAFALEVKEDYAYHMGELEFRGLDNSLTAKLRNAWKLRPGDVFDATYLAEYIPLAHKLLPSNFDWSVAPHVTANVRDKTVDVDLQYTVKALK
jgi:outer membrane protein assembly factor BamA